MSLFNIEHENIVFDFYYHYAPKAIDKYYWDKINIENVVKILIVDSPSTLFTIEYENEYEKINSFLKQHYGNVERFKYKDKNKTSFADWDSELISYITEGKYKNLNDGEIEKLQSVCKTFNINPPNNLSEDEKNNWKGFTE